MKFFMVSQCGEGAGILKQIQDEGNDCEIFINEDIYDTVYDGILYKSEEIEPDKDAIVIFDMSGNGVLADDMRSEGYKVFGASQFADDLESDRQFGLDVMRYCGIKLPETQEFKDFEEVPEFLDANEGKKFVFKPCGKMPCKLTYCSEDHEDLITYLKFVNKQFGDKIDSFVLQEFVEGDLISTELFFDGEKSVGEINHTVEAKKFLNDDLGPSTGCSGNIVWLCPDSKVAKEGVCKIEKVLKQQQYVGQIDLNAVVNEQGVWGLEWTPRFGYDSMPTYMRMLGIEYGKFFSDIVNKKANSWPHKASSMCAVRFSVPPYPAEPEDEMDEEEVHKVLPNFDIPINHWETFNANLYFYEVMMREGLLRHSSGLGVIGLAIHENPKRCYEILEKVKVPDKQYRTDLAKLLVKMRHDAERWT